MRSAEQQTHAFVPRNDRSGALPPRPAGGQARRQPAPSFASCDRRPRGRSGRRLGKPRSPSSASGDPCRSRIDRRGAPLHVAESIGPRTRALAARFRSSARAPGTPRYPLEAPLARGSMAVGGFVGRSERRLAPTSLRLDRDSRQRRLDRGSKLGGVALVREPDRRDASNRYRAIHFSKTSTRHFARLPAADHRCAVSVAFHAASLASARLAQTCRCGVLFRPAFGEPNLWSPSPNQSRTNLRRVRARQLLDRERFHRRFVEKSRLPRSEDLPSPGGQGRSRGREGCKPGRRRSRHPFARLRLRREELARPAVSAAATAVARRTDDA